MTGPLHTATILGVPLRLYRHPVLQHSFAWSALADLAAVAGYPPEGQAMVVLQWRAAYPDKFAVAGDGAIIVSDPIARGFLEWLGLEGWPEADSGLADYDKAVEALCLRMTAHIPYPEWLQIMQRAALVDAVAMPDARAN